MRALFHRSLSPFDLLVRPFLPLCPHRYILALCNKYGVHMARQYNANNTYSCPAFPHRANRSSKEQQYPLLNGCGDHPLRPMRFFMTRIVQNFTLPQDNYAWELRSAFIFIDLRPFYNARTFTFHTCSLPHSPVTARICGTVRDVILTWQVRALRFREWKLVFTSDIESTYRIFHELASSDDRKILKFRRGVALQKKFSLTRA